MVTSLNAFMVRSLSSFPAPSVVFEASQARGNGLKRRKSKAMALEAE